MNSVNPMPRRSFSALVIWDNFADYHYSRLDAARRSAAMYDIHVSGLELTGGTASHAWATRSQRPEVTTIMSSGPSSLAAWVRFVFKIYDVISVQRPGVVFAPSYWPARPFVLLAMLRVMGVPVIMMNESHGGSGNSSTIVKAVKWLLLRLFTGAFVAGSAHKRYFCELGFSVDSVVVGYSAIDGHKIRRAVEDEKRMSACDVRYTVPKGCVLSLGRLVEKKNVEAVVMAYGLLLRRTEEQIPPLVIVGEGVQRTAIESQARSVGVPVHRFVEGSDFRGMRRCVCMYPFCSNSEAPYFYRSAGIFVLASKREEWGLVVNEAIAACTPVIVSSAVGCVEDLVHDGINGYSFDPANVELLCNLMFACLTDSALRHRLSDGAAGMLNAVSIERFSSGLILSLVRASKYVQCCDSMVV